MCHWRIGLMKPVASMVALDRNDCDGGEDETKADAVERTNQEQGHLRANIEIESAV